MKKVIIKSTIFVLFVVLISFLTSQSKTNSEMANNNKISGSLSDSLASAKNELILVLGEDSILKKKIKNLKLSYTDCESKIPSLLPDFLYNKESATIEICNVKLLSKTTDFQQRIVFEFFSNHDLCLKAPNEVVENICKDRNQNERYAVKRVLASEEKKSEYLMTLNVDYGDKRSIFMVYKGINKKSKMAYKSNYGQQGMVLLEDEDIKYLVKQLSKVKRKFSKPKCKRRVIKLFAFNEQKQRFRSFACIEDIDAQAQRLLKLSRTVSSLAEGKL